MLSIINGKVDSGDDVGVVARAISAENLDSDEVGALGYAVLGAACGACDVGSMAVAVVVPRAVAGVVGAEGCAAAKVAVAGVDALILVSA